MLVFFFKNPITHTNAYTSLLGFIFISVKFRFRQIMPELVRTTPPFRNFVKNVQVSRSKILNAFNNRIVEIFCPWLHVISYGT